MHINIGLGIDLNSRVIYFEDYSSLTFESGTHVFITTDEGNTFTAYSVGGTNRVYYTVNGISTMLYDSGDGGVVRTSSKMPNDFGTVISVDTSVPAYDCIKRGTHEKIYGYDEDLSKVGLHPEYENGDEVYLYRTMAVGSLTGANKAIQFFIPLPKPVSNDVNTVQYYSSAITVRHADGGYVLDGVSADSVGTIMTDITNTGVYVVITLNTASTFTNNAPVSVFFGVGDRLIFGSTN